MNNSPYKNQLATAGLFLQALDSRQKEIPNLISAHLGDRVMTIADIKNKVAPVAADATDPKDPKKNSQAIAALPIGGRVKLDVWNDKLDLIKSKPVGTVAEREKMPFEVTPFMLYLTREVNTKSSSTMPNSPVSADRSSVAADKPGQQ